MFRTKLKISLSSFKHATAFGFFDLKCCFLLKKDYDVEKVAQKSDESQVDGGQGNLPGTRKIYEFYNAPIVKFWFHTVGHYTRTSITKPSFYPSDAT